jgi:hypothetical protein
LEPWVLLTELLPELYLVLEDLAYLLVNVSHLQIVIVYVTQLCLLAIKIHFVIEGLAEFLLDEVVVAFVEVAHAFLKGMREDGDGPGELFGVDEELCVFVHEDDFVLETPAVALEGFQEYIVDDFHSQDLYGFVVHLRELLLVVLGAVTLGG